MKRHTETPFIATMAKDTIYMHNVDRSIPREMAMRTPLVIKRLGQAVVCLIQLAYENLKDV